MPRVRLLQHVARLVTRLVVPPVVDNFDNVARRRLLRVARLVTRLVVDYSASRGSSRRS
jgi:predicted Kef-type K+ transport protein